MNLYNAKEYFGEGLFMPYHIEWHTPNEIIYEKFFGVVTLKEVSDMGNIGREWAAQVPHQTVHVLLDLSELENVSFSLKDLAQTHFPPVLPNFGWVVFVTNPHTNSHRIVNFFSLIFARILSLKWHVVHSQSDALSFLASQS